MLDSEEWRAAEVPRELQEAVDAVLAQGQGQDNKKPDKPKRAGKFFLLYSNYFGYSKILSYSTRTLTGTNTAPKNLYQLGNLPILLLTKPH